MKKFSVYIKVRFSISIYYFIPSSSYKIIFFLRCNFIELRFRCKRTPVRLYLHRPRRHTSPPLVHIFVLIHHYSMLLARFPTNVSSYRWTRCLLRQLRIIQRNFPKLDGNAAFVLVFHVIQLVWRAVVTLDALSASAKYSWQEMDRSTRARPRLVLNRVQFAARRSPPITSTSTLRGRFWLSNHGWWCVWNAKIVNMCRTQSVLHVMSWTPAWNVELYVLDVRLRVACKKRSITPINAIRWWSFALNVRIQYATLNARNITVTTSYTNYVGTRMHQSRRVNLARYRIQLSRRTIGVFCLMTLFPPIGVRHLRFY
jgi:hypothetical protein